MEQWLLYLFALITASPCLTGPAVDPVHVSGVGLALQPAVHVAEDLGEVDHLDVVVPPVTGDHGVVRPGPEVARPVRGEGDGLVVQSVYVDDVERSVRHEVVTSERSPAYWAD